MKTLWVLGSLIAFSAALLAAGSVFANNGPHGGYTATTDACAGCHRAHTGQGSRLLAASSTQALCDSCHGAAGTGAVTNVADGEYLGSAEGTLNGPMNGGGFSTYKGVSVTSSHDTNPTSAISATWGYSLTNTGQTQNISRNLSCTSCHSVHGSTNYRILRTSVNSVPVTVTLVDETNRSYTDESWGAGMNEFCGSCHTAYLASSGSGKTPYTLNGVTTYRHAVGMPYKSSSSTRPNPETVGMAEGPITYTLPLADGATPDSVVVCTTCHLAHGTSAAQGTWSTGANAATTGDSSLLRLDNRGVCEVCHQK